MRILRIGLMVVLAVLWAGVVRADKADVPQTGQVLCYNSDGTVIPCAGTGQDGALQKGVELPTPRFTDQGDGTIKDNLTKLTWLKNANCPQRARRWQTALNDVASLNASGKMNGNDCGDTSGKKGTHNTDWRLPNIRELFSLVDFAFSDPAISDAAGTGQGSANDPFTNFQASNYWSSTTYAFFDFEAWEVNFFFGRAGPHIKGGISPGGDDAFDYVIAVRGGS
jgi:hypothetical protein